MRLVVGITGATGVVLGIRMLEALRAAGVETHLVMSEWAEKTLRIETDYTPDDVRQLATVTYDPRNQAAAIASGSFPTDGMVIAPCSMHTLAAVAHGLGSNLIHRAADVTLKERRRLVLLARETPLHAIHLENMLRLAQAGATIVPPMLAFYNRPASVQDLVDHIVARTLDQIGVQTDLTVRWPEQRRMGGDA